MKINYNTDGKWSVCSVQKRYRELSLEIGGVGGFQPEPKSYTNRQGKTWIYNVMDSVVDGVKLGDRACVELSIEYIQDGVIAPSTGYIRESMARELRNIELTNKQKQALASKFISQLSTGKILKEYREYIRLFKVIGIAPYKRDIEILKKSEKQYVRRAVVKLLA